MRETTQKQVLFRSQGTEKGKQKPEIVVTFHVPVSKIADQSKQRKEGFLLEYKLKSYSLARQARHAGRSIDSANDIAFLIRK